MGQLGELVGNKEGSRDRHWGPLGTCRGFGGMCEGCGKHAWHTEALRKVQRDRWDIGEVHVGAQETHDCVVGTWEHVRTCRRTWKDRCERTAGHVWRSSERWGHMGKCGNMGGRRGLGARHGMTQEAGGMGVTEWGTHWGSRGPTRLL